MKYIDADHLKVEIKKHIKEVKDVAGRFSPNMGFFDAKISGIYDVMALLDTLSEEPDKSMEEDLEKESPKELDEMIDDYFKSLFPNIAYYKWRTSDVYVHASPDGIRFLCDHFYELGQSQMPMPEDTVLFNKGVQEGRRLEREEMLKDAVEATVMDFSSNQPKPQIDVRLDPHKYHTGDKVRIVVLKEEEE